MKEHIDNLEKSFELKMKMTTKNNDENKLSPSYSQIWCMTI